MQSRRIKRAVVRRKCDLYRHVPTASSRSLLDYGIKNGGSSATLDGV